MYISFIFSISSFVPKYLLISSDDKLISTIGISDLIVVSTNDAVMVCRKDKAQDVKKIVEQLKEEDRQEYM